MGRNERALRLTEQGRVLPYLLDVGVVLDDDGVLDVGARGRGPVAAVVAAAALLVAGRGHAARVEEDLEGGAEVARAGLEVHAVRVTVKA